VDEGTLFITIAGTAAAGFVSGLSGFAFALVALSFWVWALDPALISPMAVFGSFVSQLLSLGAVRRGLDLPRMLPFILGGALGVPLGVRLLAYIDIEIFRVAVGAILVLYCGTMLALAAPPRIAWGGRVADGAIGGIGGVMGGLAGLTGPVPILWCTLRGWDKDTQRAVFQSFNLAMHTLTLTAYGVSGTLTLPVLKVFAVMLPIIVLPTWAGARLYRRVSEGVFRRVVLWLLVGSGVTLLAAAARNL
jgi:uncharacterized protein